MIRERCVSQLKGVMSKVEKETMAVFILRLLRESDTNSEIFLLFCTHETKEILPTNLVV